jgi:CRISPR-associated endonuclease/helicase Cas3
VNGLDVRHALVDHLRGTAELAARFAAAFGAADVAYWLGLLHDAGKASCSWQEGLRRAELTGGTVGLDHKSLGCLLAQKRGLQKFALAIEGHHGGLTAAHELANRLRNLDAAARDRNDEAEGVLREFLAKLGESSPVPLPAWWQAAQPLVAELGLRMVFSALCDADFLDTAAHFAAADSPSVRAPVDFGQLRDRFETRRAAFVACREGSPVDAARGEVYRACVAAAAGSNGIYRLAAPTGSGKTIAAAGFALHHAAARGLRRVVVAVPFLTITEQNAQVYRELLEDDAAGDDPPVVLEHHSQVDFDQDPPRSRWLRLAAENWDAPFVVTTTVRLFETIFGRKPAAMRRLHRLAGSVIVLDEVQALPHRLLVPILDALRTLVKHFGVTVVLSSATQPEFWHLSPFRDLPATDILPEPRALAAGLRRVQFAWRTQQSPTLGEVAEEAAGCHQVMVVVNTTADAATVFDHWRTWPGDQVGWHLSTRMCPAHRRRVLAAVRDRLARGEPTLLVSTQLIEAGVDVDFPVVYRALAPADSLLQAAGRANREGRLPQPGQVIIVDPADGGRPPSYPTLVGATRLHFGEGKADPDDHEALAAYYRTVYGSLNLESPQHVGQRIQARRREFDFRSVTDGPLVDAINRIRDRGEAFRMIEDDGISLVTPQGAPDPDTRREIDELLTALRTSPRPPMSAFRRLQPYTTALHRSALRQAGVLSLIAPVVGDVGHPGALAEWIGEYDPATGIQLDPHVEDYVL